MAGTPANLLRQGPDEAGMTLVALIRKALSQHPHTILKGLCIGMAGAGTTHAQDTLKLRLSLLLPTLDSVPVKVVHDGVTALEGAFEDGSGLMVIAGTGSLIYGRTEDGTTVRAGGWGYVLGDEGSGHALGVRGLRAVCHAYDGGADTLMVRLLSEREGITRGSMLLHRVYLDGWQVQKMAPLVMEAADAGDSLAARIVEEEVSALMAQTMRLVQNSATITPRLALHGGLADSPYYWNTFERVLSAALPEWTLCRPEADALEGALRIAQSGV